MCYLGSLQLPLLTIPRVVSWLDYSGAFLNINDTEAQADGHCMLEMYDFVDRDAGCVRGQNLSFQHLLALAQNFQKTDPKDSVFATMGMLRPEEIGTLQQEL